jgi:hypothetical protein
MLKFNPFTGGFDFVTAAPNTLTFIEFLEISGDHYYEIRGNSVLNITDDVIFINGVIL